MAESFHVFAESTDVKTPGIYVRKFDLKVGPTSVPVGADITIHMTADGVPDSVSVDIQKLTACCFESYGSISLTPQLVEEVFAQPAVALDLNNLYERDDAVRDASGDNIVELSGVGYCSKCLLPLYGDFAGAIYLLVDWAATDVVDLDRLRERLEPFEPSLTEWLTSANLDPLELTLFLNEFEEEFDSWVEATVRELMESREMSAAEL